MCGECKLR